MTRFLVGTGSCVVTAIGSTLMGVQMAKGHEYSPEFIACAVVTLIAVVVNVIMTIDTSTDK